MKKIKLPVICAILFHCIHLNAQNITKDVEIQAETILQQMTLEEKIDYISGYNNFYIRAIPRLGVPEIKMSDGPQGIRNDTKSTMQGGFVWDWVDQGFEVTDETGRKYWSYGGDMGSQNYTNDENFCHNGLVFPDRIPHPGLMEVKKFYQDINFKAKQPETGQITIMNGFHYTNLKDYTFKYEVLKNGLIIKNGTFDVDLAPESQKQVQLDLPEIRMTDGVEYFLNVFAYTRIGSEMIPQGYEVAREQFSLGTGKYFVQPSKTSGTVKTNEDNNFIYLNTEKENVSVSIDKKSGLINDYKTDNTSYFNKKPIPNFWRAPTDNDYGNNMELGCSF